MLHVHKPVYVLHIYCSVTAVICSGDAAIYYHGVEGSKNDTGLSSGLEAVMGNNFEFQWLGVYWPRDHIVLSLVKSVIVI